MFHILTNIVLLLLLIVTLLLILVVVVFFFFSMYMYLSLRSCNDYYYICTAIALNKLITLFKLLLQSSH